MKTIKFIELIGYALSTFVMGWASVAMLAGDTFYTVNESYQGAMRIFGVLAVIFTFTLAYVTYKKWKEYRSDDQAE